MGILLTVWSNKSVSPIFYGKLFPFLSALIDTYGGGHVSVAICHIFHNGKVHTLVLSCPLVVSDAVPLCPVGFPPVSDMLPYCHAYLADDIVYEVLHCATSRLCLERLASLSVIPIPLQLSLKFPYAIRIHK